MVIVDYFSRFLVVKKVKDVTSEAAIRSFTEFWLPYYGVPHVLLVDRGPAFVSTRFQEFVTKELGAELLFSGPAYPQGNSLNESAHKGIEASILTRRQYDPEVDFIELLEDVLLAYNSTPYSMTGSSPFYMLYRKEMILPGLVSFSATVTEAQRTARQEDVKIQAIRRAILAKDNNFHIYKKEDFVIGDLVVYRLQQYEKREKETDEDYTLTKYSPEWSLPVRIKDRGMNTVTVVTESGRDLVLPKRLVRKTGTNLLDSLQQLASTIIQTETTQRQKRGRLIQLPDDTKKRRVLLA